MCCCSVLLYIYFSYELLSIIFPIFTKQDIKCTSTSWKMYKFVWLYIIMRMIMIRWFFWYVIDDSQNDATHTDTRVDNDCTSSVHDDSGKPFVIVLSYKNCISCTRDHNSVTKKDCR